MPITNNLRKQVDLPTFEWCRFAPAVSTAISSATSANNSNFNPLHGRYIYYLIAAASFWRYDTWTDTYEQLSTPAIAPVTWTTMQFIAKGYESHVISATSNTLTCAGVMASSLTSYDGFIISGTGAGQRRDIVDVEDAVIADSGVVTAVANAAGGISITDTTKNWAINQWVGYQVRIVSGSGVGQLRKVLYNTATVITMGDSTKMADDIFANPAVFTPAIAVTAGSQSIYQIESSVVIFDTPWDVIPDSTSRFKVDSGHVWLVSSAAGTPFYTLQCYEIATDIWYIRTAGTPIVTAVGVEGSIDLTGEESSVWANGFATGGTVATLIDATKTWTTNEWSGLWLYIWTGTAHTQLRQIISNTNNTLTWAASASNIAPDTTSQYWICGYTAGVVTSATQWTLTDTSQNFATNTPALSANWSNYCVRILSGTGMGQVAPIAFNTATTLNLLKPWITIPDTTSQYVVVTDNDKITFSMSANANLLFHNIDDDLPSYGRNVASGTARIGSVGTQFGTGVVPVGNYKPIAISTITQVTSTATATTATNHNLKAGQQVSILGATGATAGYYNGVFNIATAPSTTTFTYTMTGSPGSNAVFGTLSTSLLIDAAANWPTNAFVGYTLLYTTAAVTAATGSTAMIGATITSNTSNSITIPAATIPVNGVTRYVVYNNHALGSLYDGVATAGAATSLTQSTANWPVNLYAGRYLKITGGTSQGGHVVINSNTFNVLSFTTGSIAPAANSTFSILGQGLRGTGAAVLNAYGGNWPESTGYPNNARYMYIAKGGAIAGFDRFDYTNDTFTTISYSPYIETLTGGSNYAYDGDNRIYITKADAVNSQIRFYYLTLDTNHLHGAGMQPYIYLAVPAAGNRMEIFTTADGLNYLWYQRGSGQESLRQLLFY